MANTMNTKMNEKIKNQLANKENTPSKGRKNVYELMQDMKSEFSKALPKHIVADRFIRTAYTEVRRNPDLLSADAGSLMGAIMQSAQLGLLPGSVLGHAYLIPYFNRKTGTKEVQFQIGYKGYIELLRRTGEVTTIVAREVYANDKFDVDYGLEDNLIHKPTITGDRGEVIAYYCVVKMRDGGHSFLVMSKTDVEKHRDKHAASKNGPWANHFDAMAKKTVIKQLVNYLPLSMEVQQNISLDETVRKDVTAEPEKIDYDVIDMEMPEPEPEQVQQESQ